MYASNLRAPKYRKQTLTELKGEVDSNIIIVEDLNTPFSIMDRTSRQKIKNEMLDFNHTLDQM